VIDPTRERLFDLPEIPAELEKLGIFGPKGGRVHRSFGYRLRDQGLEILVVSGRMYTSAEALLRLFHARTRDRVKRQPLAEDDATAKAEAVAANERLRRLAFRRRTRKGKR
jgi:hypothetical protein